MMSINRSRACVVHGLLAFVDCCTWLAVGVQSLVVLLGFKVYLLLLTTLPYLACSWVEGLAVLLAFKA